VIPENAVFNPKYEKEVLNGVAVLKGEAIRKGRLKKQSTKIQLTAIPYL